MSQFHPFSEAGWYRCTTCSDDIHKNLAYNTRFSNITNKTPNDYFCSESCYYEYHQKKNDETSSRKKTDEDSTS